MKMFKKAELEFKNGYLLDGDEVVEVSGSLVRDFNQLEYLYQKALHNKDNKVSPVEQKEFEFQSAYDNLQVEVNTPTLDAKAKETVKLLDELDSVSIANNANELLDEFKNLVLFVTEESFVEGEFGTLKFDMKTIGNPLELDVDKLTDIILTIANNG